MNGTMTAMGKVCLYESCYHINGFLVPIKIVGTLTIVDKKFVHFVVYLFSSANMSANMIILKLHAMQNYFGKITNKTM